MEKSTLNKGRLPEWFRQDIPKPQALSRFRYFKKQGVNTVCLEAGCPNWSRCFSKNTVTFMILGNRCTRSCRFCAVEKSREKSLFLDKQEPHRILKTIKVFRLNFIILTSVTRDDLVDCGAGQFVRTINLIRNYKRNIKIEILIPDFIGPTLKCVVLTCPDVLAHNIETVPSLYSRLRKGSDYQRSLQVIAQTKKINPHLITKSSLLLGMGERQKEVIRVMHDLFGVGCDILVLGQYLAPTLRHYPIKEFLSLEQFQRYKDIGLNLGFRAVLSSPLARTSYRAEELYNNLQRITYNK
jgi:lipoic acid synthetase